MTDTEMRLIVVGAIVAVTVAVGMFGRRGAAVRRRPVELIGLGPGPVFFTSTSCASCDEVRRRLERVGVAYIEKVHGGDDEVFPEVVTRVPALAVIGDDGTGWIAFGVPSEARLRRWLDGP